MDNINSRSYSYLIIREWNLKFFFYFVNLDISDSVLVARGFFKAFLCVVRIASGVKNRRLMHSKGYSYVDIINEYEKLFD